MWLEENDEREGEPRIGTQVVRSRSAESRPGFADPGPLRGWRFFEIEL